MRFLSIAYCCWASFFSWYTITITPLFDRESITIISDQSSLDKFLNDLNEEAQRKHEPKPINIPCGIILYSLNIPNPDHIEVSGYLWTKYNINEHKNIVHGIDILQETRIFVGKPLTSTAGEWETETWTIQGTIAQEQQNAYSIYKVDPDGCCSRNDRCNTIREKNKPVYGPSMEKRISLFTCNK